MVSNVYNLCLIVNISKTIKKLIYMTFGCLILNFSLMWRAFRVPSENKQLWSVVKKLKIVILTTHQPSPFTYLLIYKI